MFHERNSKEFILCAVAVAALKLFPGTHMNSSASGPNLQASSTGIAKMQIMTMTAFSNMYSHEHIEDREALRQMAPLLTCCTMSLEEITARRWHATKDCVATPICATTCESTSWMPLERSSPKLRPVSNGPVPTFGSASLLVALLPEASPRPDPAGAADGALPAESEAGVAARSSNAARSHVSSE